MIEMFFISVLFVAWVFILGVTIQRVRVELRQRPFEDADKYWFSSFGMAFIIIAFAYWLIVFL